MVRDAGLKADTLSVSVAPFDPTLLLGRARKITLIASGVDASPARIGSVNLSIGDASYFDRSFKTVSGYARRRDRDGQRMRPVHIGDVTVDGPADAASATAQLSATDTDRLIRLAGKRAGLTIDEVHVGDSGVTVKVSGIESDARLAVSGGALVLDPGVGGPIVLASASAIGSVAAQGSMGLGRRAERPRRRRHDRARRPSGQPELNAGLVGEVGFEPTRRSRGTGS